MTKLTITGNTTPTVGIIETYALSVFDHSAPPNVFQPNLSKKAEWYIEILEKGIWKKSKGDHKVGDAVTFRFSQRSLSRKAIKIVVKRGEDKGELLIKPQRSKEAKITRVELLDENYQPIPKGKILNYHDTLIARAHCVEMFWNYISFTLWEDDAKGEGHDPVINMMNKINPIPLRGEVNEKGIAEVTFRLPFYTMAVQIANAHIAAGDTDEGPTHEYYVTAELVSKHIMKASPNVNVANPTHIPPAPPSKTSSNTPEEKPQKPKPKADTPKFKISSNGKKQADPDAKILNAEFLNERGQLIEKAEVGDTVIIKITTQNMKGRNVTVRIWEEETGYKTYDKIYEKKWVLPGNENFIKVLITKRIYELGITPEDMANEKYDYKFQVYFIEVEPDNTHVTSQVIPISKTAPKLEVENSPSVAIIKKPRIVEKKEEKGKCPRCKEKITITQIENLFGTYTKHRSYRQEIIDNLNKYIFDSGKEIHINTCLRKAHFFAQVGAETLGMNPDWMVETDVYRYSKNRCFEVFGERAKNLNAKGLLDKYCMDNPQKRLLNYLYAHENGFGNGNRNEASGDGYIYRGRGLKQLTGKENYKNASQYIKEYFPNEYIDLVEDPDKVKTAKYAVLSAIAYWEKHEIWKVADTLKVSNDENIKK
ncbi:hypothetical protein [Chryseobacterium sp. ERMR1:04]|uniref:hypothetical protein n=1 Tax=Chryseobacterium sp. ERMR1:04 TaxID=1705393 RepID=UPI0006C85511|nr:hypothetical protein [Chryseobacterium sp. ERMR1:04]